jgi:hypothetical protein
VRGGAPLPPTPPPPPPPPLRENAELLRTFKQIATLQPIDGIARPPDRATDYAGGAHAAGEMGMRRLAERLEKLSKV